MNVEKELSNLHKEVLAVGATINEMLTKRKASPGTVAYQSKRLNKLAVDALALSNAMRGRSDPGRPVPPHGSGP
jgi:hypothetical protein